MAISRNRFSSTFVVYAFVACMWGAHASSSDARAAADFEVTRSLGLAEHDVASHDKVLHDVALRGVPVMNRGSGVSRVSKAPPYKEPRLILHDTGSESFSLDHSRRLRTRMHEEGGHAQKHPLAMFMEEYFGAFGDYAFVPCTCWHNRGTCGALCMCILPLSQCTC